MQGQQTVATGATASGIASNSTVNASATGTSNPAGTSVTTITTINDKPAAAATTITTNRSNNSPPPSLVPAAATTVNGPGESDALNSLDEQTTTGGDSINKDHS
jgi:hypothetical protein